MASLNITNTDAGTPAVIVEVWERGGGQADTLLETHPLDSGDTAARLTVCATRYLVVRGATDSDAKTIDNWSQTPPAPADA